MIYLLLGENSFELQQRIKKLVANFSGEVEKFDGSELSLEMLPDLLMGVTLFSSKRLIVIKQATENKLLWNVLGEWLEKSSDTDVVLVERSPDKRTKTFKWLQKNAEVYEVKELQPYDAVNWLKTEAGNRGLVLDQSTAQYFVDYVGVDQWRLSSELDKLALTQQPVTRELIQDIAEPTPQATSFELLDAAFAGHGERVEQLLQTVARQEDPYMFFGLMAGQVFAIAAVKSGQGRRSDEVAKETGVHPYVARKVMSLAQRLSQTELQRLVTGLAELDAHMKLRAVDPWVQIRSFLKTVQ